MPPCLQRVPVQREERVADPAAVSGEDNLPAHLGQHVLQPPAGQHPRRGGGERESGREEVSEDGRGEEDDRKGKGRK